MPEAEFSIGEVAENAGVSISAIRYYERSGLLPEAERVGGQRRFAADTVRRLEVIGVAKRAGFSLAEIKALLTSIDEGAPAREQLRALAPVACPKWMRRSNSLSSGAIGLRWPGPALASRWTTAAYSTRRLLRAESPGVLLRWQ